MASETAMMLNDHTNASKYFNMIRERCDPCLPALLRHIPIPSGAGDAGRFSNGCTFGYLTVNKTSISVGTTNE